MADDPTRSLSGQSGAEPTGSVAPDGITPGESPSEHTGLPGRIGRYTIRRVIGEGGMGTVYEAEQESPKRTVALKVIRAGYLTREMLRRFEHESAVLGRLQHPGIAQIYEAGVIVEPPLEAGGAGDPTSPSVHPPTPAGGSTSRSTPTPFFAMELVRGVPLTEFANARRLGTRERLDLVAKVCDAVYHAHQKGVIHRDLKPGNILVDESGQPKILDFGVARATDSDVQATTIQTDIGQLIGTVPYMSPEQVGGDPGDLDTRSDVYALGVIAYELLAGRLPYDVKRKMIHEAARIIKEEEPTRLSSINRTLRGDVETIVAKALDKAKARRYQSAESLASDIRRYLRHEPIAARPASTWYQVSKFSRRNRALVGGVAASFVLLVAGLAGTAWQARAAREQRDAAREARDAEAAQRGIADGERDRAVAAERDAVRRAEDLAKVAAFQGKMLAQVDPAVAGVMLTRDASARLRAGLEKAGVPGEERESRVRSFAEEWGYINATDAARGLIDATILKPATGAIDAQFQDQPLVGASLRQVIADRYTDLGLFDAAEPVQALALATRARELGEEHPDTMVSQNGAALLLIYRGRAEEAEQVFRELLERRRRVLGDEHPDTLRAINNLAFALEQRGKCEESELLRREAMEKSPRVLGPDHPDTLGTINGLGAALHEQNKHAEAEALFREALAGQGRVLGSDHPYTLGSLNNLAVVLAAQRKDAEAERCYRECLESRRCVLGEDHADTLSTLNNLGALLRSHGRLDEAEPLYREVMQKFSKTLGTNHPNTAVAFGNMGALLRARGDMAGAEEHFRQSLAKLRASVGPHHPHTTTTLTALADVLEAREKFAEADVVHAELVEAYRAVLRPGDWRIGAMELRAGGSLLAQGRFADAEALVLSGFAKLQADAGTPRAPSDWLKEGCERVVKLYESWHAAEPGKGYDVKAAEWKAKLD